MIPCKVQLLSKKLNFFIQNIGMEWLVVTMEKEEKGGIFYES